LQRVNAASLGAPAFPYTKYSFGQRSGREPLNNHRTKTGRAPPHCPNGTHWQENRSPSKMPIASIFS